MRRIKRLVRKRKGGGGFGERINGMLGRVKQRRDSSCIKFVQCQRKEIVTVFKFILMICTFHNLTWLYYCLYLSSE